MHELSLAASIVEMVVAQAAGRAVHRVTIEVGCDSGVSLTVLSENLELVAEGTDVEDAVFDIVSIDGAVLTLKSMEVLEMA
jgi:Zn finger protein HypA/HybF involved in hydrogenase expression